ncbi:protein trunk [Athalia rosae]|uniref:protein trunk n=1 Tax=Athalia rosae TaxID=37344 RepID=UPI002033E659|nr:protein trunk [Athalia rosae]
MCSKSTILLAIPLLCHLTSLAVSAVIKRTGSTRDQLLETVERMNFGSGVVRPEKCQTIPESVLSAVLGPAFNARYMSINDPRDNNVESGRTASGVTKRKTSKIPSFSVEEEFNSVYSNDPAWDFEFGNVGYEEEVELVQNARDTRETKRAKSTPWQCDANVEWIDLGHDYFPRFLRMIECEKSNCWYGFYTCKPRSFTVKLLRRRRGICIPSPAVDEILRSSKMGVDGLPNELKELWIWEERAVNFCCECTAGP